ncbi:MULTISPECIES: M20 family metallopeptidase [Aerococcus]|uniref:Peptidase M20 domain-containing protein 2 n=1 Tax=Aerococcus sanguinicola TaxID=119206 RepID=A0A5N1GJ17_9LACT|nr:MULTISPECIES: M20 family metallopeptidase [Aerococcus]KAA9300179.1 M20 family metallopeptidase [Aerococcus sanguinicola]MDK6369521.1 M20 family metallopeptidase [Aerococcus sp. UMB9870]MDK6680008.1 M20 family metallopeptidase [Aerococcus sp. UMB8608]MDK6686110.1 M20 family metallopeptidase [Aerococcus sp. UMB8623]MDK6939890.1 M20 family metallopeptidase [Aerococcus sp. UMB8487]
MGKEQLTTICKDLREEFQALSDYIYDHPELGLEEDQSSQAHVDLLEKHGFQVEKPYLGFETAFRATYDSAKPGPTVAYLSEYDALPEIGHGCGHNMLGTVDTGAAIVLSKVLGETGGRLVVLGTPAEETNGVKVDMAAADTFDDIDVALCTHPSDANTKSAPSLAMQALEFEFFGKNAHAAAAPWQGINALDAVINLFNLVNAQRQQILPTARIHGVIKDGGEVANVIPDYTRAHFYVRARDKAYVQVLREMMIRMAESAAQAAGCTMKYRNYEKTYDDMVTNRPLDDAYNANAKAVGIDMVDPDPNEVVGSLDMGNVSHVVPATNPYYSITDGQKISGHTPEFRDCTKTEAGYQAMMATIEILARTGYDVLTDPELLKAIQKDFKAE